MKTNIFALLILGLIHAAHASGVKILEDGASKKLYSSLNVTVIDADDILEKHFIAADVSISCFKSVVDKSASCHVPAEKITLNGLDAKKLYRALKVKPEDHDDIITKTLALEGFKFECKFYVVDKDYSCTLTP